MLIQLGLALGLSFSLPLAVSWLFRMSNVHFRLPDDIDVKLILIGIKMQMT